jgi:malate dehydrogenase (oxaloacetate-decarboxylating)(NADP+)
MWLQVHRRIRVIHRFTHIHVSFVFGYLLRAGNNAYIFPGIGLGVLTAGLTRITNHDMLIAARSLASQVTDKELEVGCVYPPLTIIREVAARIAAAIAENAHDTGKATKPRPTDMLTYVKSLMYDPFDDPFQAQYR